MRAPSRGGWRAPNAADWSDENADDAAEDSRDAGQKSSLADRIEREHQAAIQAARRDAAEARQTAYDLEPLNVDDHDDVARELDRLATAVHLLSTAVLRLCDEIDPRGPGR